jgi:hypothetical protein
MRSAWIRAFWADIANEWDGYDVFQVLMEEVINEARQPSGVERSDARGGNDYGQRLGLKLCHRVRVRHTRAVRGRRLLSWA